MEFFATVVKGLEEFGADEVRRTAANGVVKDPGMVHFQASLPDVYRLYAHSRSLKRLHLKLTEARAGTLQRIYEGAREGPIERYVGRNQRIAVRAHRSGNHPFNSPDVAERIGRALLDRFRQRRGNRPEVDLERPDIVIRAYLRDERLLVGIDLGDGPLDRRRDRSHFHPAPLNATVAHAMLREAGWGEGFLVDPMCGSGTIPLEAATMRRPGPGRSIPQTGMSCLRAFDSETYETRRRSGQKKYTAPPHFTGLGGDLRRPFVRLARQHAHQSGVADSLLFLHREVSALPLPNRVSHVVTNPPFGIRGDPPRLMREAYQSFWSWIHGASSLRLAVLCGNPVWHDYAPVEPVHRRPLKLGELNCSILIYQLP